MVFLRKVVSDTFHEFLILLIPIQPTKWNNDVASKEEEPYFRFSEELISLSHRTTRLIEILSARYRMEIYNVQKEKPRDKHSEYYILRFDPFQKLMQGEWLKALSSLYEFKVETSVPVYQGEYKTRIIVPSISKEAFIRLSNEDASLLLPCLFTWIKVSST